jgi:hypothetical protein
MAGAYHFSILPDRMTDTSFSCTKNVEFKAEKKSAEECADAIYGKHRIRACGWRRGSSGDANCLDTKGMKELKKTMGRCYACESKFKSKL